MIIKNFFVLGCVSCSALDSALRQVVSTRPDVAVEDINIDDNQQLVQEFDIHSVPTLIKFRNGVEINRAEGALNAENLMRWLDN